MTPRWKSAARWSRRLRARLTTRRRCFGHRQPVATWRPLRQSRANALRRVWLRRALRGGVRSTIRIVSVTIAGARISGPSHAPGPRGSLGPPVAPRQGRALTQTSRTAPAAASAPPPATPVLRWAVPARIPGTPPRAAPARIRDGREHTVRRNGEPPPIPALPRMPASHPAFVSFTARVAASPIRPVTRAAARPHGVNGAALQTWASRPMREGRAPSQRTAVAGRPPLRSAVLVPAPRALQPAPRATGRQHLGITPTEMRAARAVAVRAVVPSRVQRPRVAAVAPRAREGSALARVAAPAPQPRSDPRRMPLLAVPRALTVPPAWSAQARPTQTTRPSTFTPASTPAAHVESTDVSASMVQLVQRTVEERVSQHIRSRSSAARALAAQLQKDLYESLRFERERLGA